MPYTANYPASVQEVLRESKKYKGDTLRALKVFRRSKAWRGTDAERKDKISALHQALRGIYGLNTDLQFGEIDNSSSGASYFNASSDCIVIRGRLSVVTYLHEFGHARGMDEKDACIWSINLFKRIFPRSFDRAQFDGHMVLRRENQHTPDSETILA